MNPIYTLVELRGWSDIHEVRQRCSRRDVAQPLLGLQLSDAEMLKWVESKEHQIYSALARRFLHLIRENPSSTEFVEISGEFTQVVMDSVIDPLAKICKLLPARGEPLQGNDSKFCVSSMNKMSSPSLSEGGSPLVVKRVGIKGGIKFYSGVTRWEWMDLFSNKEAAVGKGCVLKTLLGETPSFEQWNASTLAALRRVGDVVSEVQKDLMSALNRLAAGRFGRVIDEVSGKGCNSLWTELVFMVEDAFDDVVTDAVELILWSIHQCFLEGGVFAGHPMFSLKAFWQYSSCSAALSPAPSEVHERLMNRVKKELIWNIVPEFDLNQMIKRQVSGGPRLRRAALRNRLLEEGKMKRRWDAIHFAASQRCDELQESLQALTESYSFYFSSENEFPQMNYQRLWEVREGLRSSLTHPVLPVGSGVFVVHRDSLHQVAADKLEVAFKKVVDESKCADALSRETITAARMKALAAESDLEFYSNSLRARMDAFSRRRKVQGKYDRGLDPFAHVTRLINEQRNDEDRLRGQFTILVKKNPIQVDSAVAAPTDTATDNGLASFSVTDAASTASSANTERKRSLPKHVSYRDARTLKPPVSLNDANNVDSGGSGALPPAKPSAVYAAGIQRPQSNEHVAKVGGKNCRFKPGQGILESSKESASFQRADQRTVKAPNENDTIVTPLELIKEEHHTAIGDAGHDVELLEPTDSAAAPVCPFPSHEEKEAPRPISEFFPLFPKQCPPVSQQDADVDAAEAPLQSQRREDHMISSPEVAQPIIQHTCPDGAEECSAASEKSPLAVKGAVASAPQEGCDAPEVAASALKDEERKEYLRKLELLHFNVGAVEASEGRVRAIKKLLPFLPDMPCEGVFIEDINLSDSRIETSMNRLRAVRGSATVLRNYRDIALVEDSVSAIIESVAEELATLTLRMLLRFPFLEGRICGVLLGNLQVLEVDDEFQSLITLYRSSQKGQGPTESIEHCLRVRARALANECPYVVTPDRYEGHMITLQKDAADAVTGERPHNDSLQETTRQGSAEGALKRQQGSRASVSTAEVPKLTQRTISPEVAVPSPPSLPVEKTAETAPSLRFVRNIHVHEQPPLRCEDEVPLATNSNSRSHKAVPSFTSVVQTRRVLSPGNPQSSVGEQSCKTDQSVMKSNVSVEGDANTRKNSAQTRAAVPSTSSMRENRVLTNAQSHGWSVHSMGSAKSDNLNSTALSKERHTPDAQLLAVRKECTVPTRDSRGSGPPREKGECKDSGESESTKTSFFDTIEKGLMDERMHLQELETILRQVVKGCEAVPNIAKPKSPGLRAAKSTSVLPCVSAAPGVVECGPESSNTSPLTEKTSASSQSKWASPSPALLGKVKTVPRPPSTGRFVSRAPVSSPRPGLEPDGSMTSNPPQGTTATRGEREQDARMTGRRAGSDPTWCNVRDTSNACGDEFEKHKQRGDAFEAAGDTNHTLSGDSNQTQPWPRRRPVPDSNGSCFKSITDAVVKSSWGTLGSEMEPESDKAKLPSVSNTAQRGKLNGLFHKSQTSQINKMPWGRFTISHNPPSNVSLPNAFSSSYSADSSRMDHGNSPPFPQLSPTAKSDSPPCRTHENEVDGQLMNSVGLRQQYVIFCRRACVKPNSMLMRLFPDKPGAFVSRIDTSVNYVGPKGFLPIMQVLRLNGGLEYLNLSHNNLENDEVVELVQVLLTECGASLCFLDLSNNPISLVGGAALLRLTQMRPLLLTVHVKGTLIPQQLCRSIQEACEANAAAGV
ncbi:Flagellar Member 4 [Trypanosoma equiperdum]|uniref:Flagellar Member 4 n=1 Tax=Trypanosoma equiperdum TaxID=5694 RepID=A0A1G4IID5_TRYEQ|nr:Flagellar Member 4 [Trypanosoma equiperdum]